MDPAELSEHNCAFATAHVIRIAQLCHAGMGGTNSYACYLLILLYCLFIRACGQGAA